MTWGCESSLRGREGAWLVSNIAFLEARFPLVDVEEAAFEEAYVEGFFSSNIVFLEARFPRFVLVEEAVNGVVFWSA